MKPSRLTVTLMVQAWHALLVIYNDDKKFCLFDNLTLINTSNPLTTLPVTSTFNKMIILVAEFHSFASVQPLFNQGFFRITCFNE